MERDYGRKFFRAEPSTSKRKRQDMTRTRDLDLTSKRITYPREGGSRAPNGSCLCKAQVVKKTGKLASKTKASDDDMSRK